MPLTVVATAGAADANSFLTVAEAQDYFDARLYSDNWDNNADQQDKAVVMATRTLVAMMRPGKELTDDGSYWRVRRTWTGTPSTSTQALPWPRAGMTDGNGNAIPEDVVPDELKWATAELAMQLLAEDRTLDYDVAAKGIKSVSAGSVSLSFKDDVKAKVLPDAVVNLLPPSWFEPETFEPAMSLEFSAMGGDSSDDDGGDE